MDKQHFIYAEMEVLKKEIDIGLNDFSKRVIALSILEISLQTRICLII
jgi:hypothetical protein